MMLARAILAYVTVWITPNGAPVLVEHVREAGGAVYVHEVSSTTVESAELAGVDVLDLAAVLASESGFNERAVNTEDGTTGIAQLNPLSKWGKGARAEYELARARARADDLSTYTRTQIRWAALALRDGLDQCGSRDAAIGFYKSGKCRVGPQVARVLRIRARLQREFQP